MFSKVSRASACTRSFRRRLRTLRIGGGRETCGRWQLRFRLRRNVLTMDNHIQYGHDIYTIHC